MDHGIDRMFVVVDWDHYAGFKHPTLQTLLFRWYACPTRDVILKDKQDLAGSWTSSSVNGFSGIIMRWNLSAWMLEKDWRQIKALPPVSNHPMDLDHTPAKIGTPGKWPSK